MSGWVLALAFMLGPGLLFLAFAYTYRAWRRRDRRRSPINMKVFNQAGQTLRADIEDADSGIEGAVVMALVLGPILGCAWAIGRLQRMPGGVAALEWRWTDALYLVVIAAFLIGCMQAAARHGARRRRCMQGLWAEMATAQALTPLIADGCMVFHDLPAERFNIDHVVVTPRAVLAIETKSRRKPAQGGRDSARVTYDGRGLKFPDHATVKPIEQAARQADWLRKHLASATGDPVPVIPVIALPGWYVDLTREGSRANVVVVNPRNTGVLSKLGSAASLNPSAMRRVAHALAQRYPDLETN